MDSDSTNAVAANAAYIAYFHARLREMEQDNFYYSPELRERIEQNKKEMLQEIEWYEAEQRRLTAQAMLDKIERLILFRK